MGGKFRNIILIGLGMLAGIAASMQFSAMAQKPVAPLPLDELRQLADVFGLIKTDYVESVDDKKLLTEAISGMVSSLDPHSAYLDKKALKELKEGTQGRFGGLGIEVGTEDGFIKVISPIEDTPAYRAGIKPGDLITRLDGVSVKDMTLDEAVKRMRGEPNTKITLTIVRKNENKPLTVTIVREEIRIRSVKSKMIEPGYGWLRIAQFQEPTVEDLVKRINALYAQSPNMKGLVLDLRNDPGGILPGAIGVASIFLPKDLVVVSTNGQLPESKATFYSRPEFYAGRHLGDPLAKLPPQVKTVPVVVLVNVGSASASEIVAGALQDHKRATLLGTKTFGKGSVQTVRQISQDTAVKLTTARYYTPSGRSIQAKGIVPDLMVDETPEGDGYNSMRLREADLFKHLSDDPAHANDEAQRASEEEEQRLLSGAKKYKPLEYGSKDDFQLMQALNYLKGQPVKLSRAATDEKKNSASSAKSGTDKEHGMKGTEKNSGKENECPQIPGWQCSDKPAPGKDTGKKTGKSKP
ncbi:MAG: S41 family peptidase [Burkholderiaceae bacterium]|jgi:carboxyl-terminal processing protease|nr:S41 family peptidase [Burkholderiaceae bacterium]